MNKHLDSTKAATKPVSRRNFIAIAAAGSAVLPAVALAAASEKTSRLPQSVQLREDPFGKVRRLAGELGEALVEYGDGTWFAKVYPKNEAGGWSTFYGDIQAENDARLQVERGLVKVIADHKAAYATALTASKAVDEVALGREPTKAEMGRFRKAWKAYDAALLALLAYVPFNDPSRYLKAKYTLPLMQHAQLCDKQMRILFISMCGRCA